MLYKSRHGNLWISAMKVRTNKNQFLEEENRKIENNNKNPQPHSVLRFLVDFNMIHYFFAESSFLLFTKHAMNGVQGTLSSY